MIKVRPDFAGDGILSALYDKERKPDLDELEADLRAREKAVWDRIDKAESPRFLSLLDDIDFLREESSQYYYQKGFRLGVLTMLECFYAEE